MGMLAPQGTSVDASEDDQSGADAEDDEDLDTGVAVGQSLVSSSIGLSFIVPLATGIDYSNDFLGRVCKD